MKELIDFVSRFDKDYATSLRGASTEEIDQLEQLAGRRFPAAYREFLRYMGHDMGGVGLYGVNFDVESVANMHRQAGTEYDWPSQFLIIAEHEDDPYYHYFLDLKTLHDGECRVVGFDSTLRANELRPENIHERAPTLKEFLIHTAFLCKALGRFSHQERALFTYPKLFAGRVDSQVALALFEQAALQLGFQKVPYSTKDRIMLDRGDASIYAKAGLPGMVAMTLMGRDENEVRRIREIFSDQAAQS